MRYVRKETLSDVAQALTAGEVDLTLLLSPPFLLRLEAGDPLILLAGVHVGCFELFGTARVRGIRDLNGKTVAVTVLGGPEHVFVASMAAYIGLDPRKDIRWMSLPQDDAPRLLVEGAIDAFLTFPAFAQELWAQQIARVVVDSSRDRPWSQYFCCMVVAHRAFVRKHPVVTKRVVLAILKAADLCALAPERVGQLLVDKAYASRYDAGLQAMKEVPCGQWREYDPEDTVRFYALRLHEARMLKSSRQKLIAQGTDWRFLNELKRELKD